MKTLLIVIVALAALCHGIGVAKTSMDHHAALRAQTIELATR